MNIPSLRVCLFTFAVLLLTSSLSMADNIERISVSSNGVEGNSDSGYFAWGYNVNISSFSRYIIYVSMASNLVTGDSNGFPGIFLRDRELGTTELVDLSSSGVQGNNSAYPVGVSEDGRFVSYGSRASNLVTDDTNGSFDIFVRDRKLGTTERVSLSSAGTQLATGSTATASMSRDGRFVAFSSSSSDAVAGDTNNAVDIFVRDRELGTTVRVSVASDGTQAIGPSINPTISGNGKFVGFSSSASNLVQDDTNGVTDFFVHNLETGATERVNVASDGTQANAYNGPVPLMTISNDGRFVVFPSAASNLVSDDTNGLLDIFVRDRELGLTQRVSIASDGTQGNGGVSYQGAISADGRFVTFGSSASNLITGDTNGIMDIFIFDRSLNETRRVSTASDGSQPNNASALPTISADGKTVIFPSTATNLVIGDTNGRWDVFAVDLNTCY